MINRAMLLTAMLTCLTSAVGCAGDKNPVAPKPGRLSPATAASPELAPSHQGSNLWGFWDFALDPESNQVEFVPNRSAMFAANVVTFLNGNPPGLQFHINGTPTGPDYIDVDIDVTLVHPLNMPAYDGYDVRGVFIGKASGALEYNSHLEYPLLGPDQFLLNADGYTRWFNPSEFGVPGLFGYFPGKLASPGYTPTATLNPYKYFAENLGANDVLWDYLNSGLDDVGTFIHGTINTRNYYLRFPTPSVGVKYGYAVVANWEGANVHPAHAPEAVGCSTIVTEAVYYVDPTHNGGSLVLDVSLFGWLKQPSSIFVESTVLSNPHEFTPGEMTPTGGNAAWSTYHVDIPVDNVMSLTGQEFWVIAECGDEDYTNDYGTPNNAGYDPLASFFRFDLPVLDYVPAWLLLISPNGGEQWIAGNPHDITWNSAGLTGTVDLSYSKDGFISDIHGIASGETNDGSYPWIVPFDSSTAVRVRISSTSMPDKFDISDADFSILLPSISVTMPNGGESWQPGSSHDITWTYQNLSGTVDIAYSIDDFVSDVHNISLDEQNDGSFTWSDIPFDPSATVKVRVGSTDYPAIFDVSDANFAIPLPTITVTAPNGGESWIPGSSHDITWDSQYLSGNVDIAYSNDGFGSDIHDLALGESNDGIWSWSDIPLDPSSTLRVRVRSSSYPSVSDTSNANFTIPQPSITVSSPNGGESWAAGSSHDITWTSQYLSGDVDIIYSKNNFVSDFHDIALGEANDGTCTWPIVPDDPSTTVKVRVRSASYPGIFDNSNSNFTIFKPSITLTAPNGGEQLLQGGSATISWTSSNLTGTVFMEFSTDNFVSDIQSIAANEANDGTYTWSPLPCIASETVRVRISSTNVPSVNDKSNGDFTITEGWVRDCGYASAGSGSCTAVDGSGYIYVAGQPAFLTKFNSCSILIWEKHWGTADVQPWRVAIDSQDNVYIIGSFKGSHDFDPDPSIVNTRTSNGGWDVFLSKFDPSGNLLWVKTWGGSSDDHGLGLAVEGSSAIYVCGDFRDTVDFDPGSGSNIHSAVYYTDAWMSRFSSSGNLVWAETWGGDWIDAAQALDVDSSGDIFVGGQFYYTVDLDPGSGVYEAISNGGGNIFLSKFNSSGDFYWAKTWGGTMDDIWNGDGVGSVNVSVLGDVWVSGNFEGTNVDFDTGSGTYYLTSNGNFDAFLSKFDTSGNFYWAGSWGCPHYDVGQCLTTDSEGNAIITGWFGQDLETVDFDPGPGIDNHTTYGVEDIYLSKFDRWGNFQWCWTWGGPSMELSFGVATDSSDRIYVTGFASSYFYTNFASSEAPCNLDPYFLKDDFVAKYLPDGCW